jgi:hypothetical protein
MKRKNKGKGVRSKKARLRNPKSHTAKAEARTPKAELREPSPSILEMAMELGSEERATAPSIEDVYL